MWRCKLCACVNSEARCHGCWFGRSDRERFQATINDEIDRMRISPSERTTNGEPAEGTGGARGTTRPS